MDLEILAVEDLKRGYKFDEESGAFQCLICRAHFELGEIFEIDGRFFEAERAVQLHVERKHDILEWLLASKYNTLTERQQQLLKLFYSGETDKEIAKGLNVSPSTIRHQKFTLREKAKAAKLFLVLYEQAMAGKGKVEDTLIKVHESATQLDERYHITEKERLQTLETALESLEPLKLKIFPKKEKKKIVILNEIVKQFVKGQKYKESEVNQILKEIFDDFVTLRRYLIDYGYMDGTNDGKEYWLKP